ncbi:MAG TPA: aminoglycoside 6-adenylyltransferase [Flavisolibacter sp.]|jgi:predicted nucleotidyltransferase
MTEKLDWAVQRFRELAGQNEDIQAVVSFGSSNSQKQDKYSDLDLFLFSTDPKKYMDESDNRWLDNLGEVLSRVIVKDVVENIQLNRIIMKNELCLDIIVVNATEFKKGAYYFFLKRMRLSALLPRFARRAINASIMSFHSFLNQGHEIIYDRVNIENIIRQIFMQYGEGKEQDIVTEKKFQHNYNQFLQTCYKMNVKLVRNDFFYAIVVLDAVIRKVLIRMVEWTVLENNPGEFTDVYYNGAHISKWGSPSIIRRLYASFPHGSREEMRAALLNTLRFYLELAGALARKKGYKLNPRLEELVLNFVAQEGHQPKRGEARIKPVVQQLKEAAAHSRDIKAIVSFGSSGSSGQDALSDLDLYLFTTRPQEYFSRSAWEKYFNNILSLFVRSSGNEHVVLIMLENGLCIDVIVVNATRFQTAGKYFWLKKKGLDGILPGKMKRMVQRGMVSFYDSIKRGYEVIHDTTGIAKLIAQVIESRKDEPLVTAVDARKFHKNYHQFWQTNYKMMVKLLRTDFFYAAVVLDNLAKGCLVGMLQWHALLKDPAMDVYYNGRKIHEWCDADLADELRDTFLHTGITDMRRAMLRSMDIYKRLSHEVAGRHGFRLNPELEERVYAFVSKGLVPESLNVKQPNF